MKLTEDIKPVSYEVLRHATLLLQLMAQGETDVEAGRTVPQKEAFARVRRRLTQRGSQE
jgi:hypothetical protein